jgi:hypothetical protein
VIFVVNPGTSMANTKHPMAVENMAQHITISLLKDKKGHVSVRKQRGTVEDHYGKLIRDFCDFFVGHTY